MRISTIRSKPPADCMAQRIQKE
uniref:Uncharacterized protein n=1 Tax=Anguilla anguilla TaxID=7936 RepID=A0A0E9TX42_ANGAN